jgi:hypothetical protein
MMQTTIIQGKELSEAQIDFMNRQRMIEYGENTKDFRKNELGSIFFFLKDGETVKAFGMLKPLVITHDDQHYPILGVANIIAIEKGRGYGKLLMQVIKDYLVSKGMTGMGFCDNSVCPFYVQCGFQITQGLSSRFRYQYAQQDGQTEKQNGAYGVLHFDGGDGLVGKLLVDDKLIYIDVPFW